jgi:transposase InsO family protein
LSIRYTERLSEAGVATSVGSRGDAYDNALAETINGLYKTEVIKKKGPWKTLEEVEFATLEWVDWFNNPGCSNPSDMFPRRSSKRCSIVEKSRPKRPDSNK